MAVEPFGTNYHRLTPRQLAGSEYGGVGETRNTLQPKGKDAVTSDDELRLGYLTGDGASDPLQLTILSLEDRRQALGLKPAGDRRPIWLSNTGRTTEAEIQGAEYPPELSTIDPYVPGLGE
jgi:hypothetical protein